MDGSPRDALGLFWLPSTAVGEGEARVAGGGCVAGAEGEEAGEADAELGGDDAEPGAEGEVAAVGSDEDEGAPERRAVGEDEAAADCDAVSVAPGDEASATAEGLDVA